MIELKALRVEFFSVDQVTQSRFLLEKTKHSFVNIPNFVFKIALLNGFNTYYRDLNRGLQRITPQKMGFCVDFIESDEGQNHARLVTVFAENLLLRNTTSKQARTEVP